MTVRTCLNVIVPLLSSPPLGHAQMCWLRGLWIIDEMISELMDSTKTDEDHHRFLHRLDLLTQCLRQHTLDFRQCMLDGRDGSGKPYLADGL